MTVVKTHDVVCVGVLYERHTVPIEESVYNEALITHEVG